MRSAILIVSLTACASLACGSQKNAPSSTTLTAAHVHAPEQPPDNVYIAPPQQSIERTATIDEWRPRYPHPAHILDEWAVTYPQTASRLVAWSGREPEKLEVLVFWSVTSRVDPISVFLLDRPGWEELGAIAHDDPKGIAAFLEWVRRSPGAAEELALHAGGLQFIVPLRD